MILFENPPPCVYHPSRKKTDPLEFNLLNAVKKLDSWITWGVVGFVIGAALGVTTLSVWLVAIGLGAFIAYLVMHGPARRETEGALFASGGVFIVAWLLGFVARGLVL